MCRAFLPKADIERDDDPDDDARMDHIPFVPAGAGGGPFLRRLPISRENHLLLRWRFCQETDDHDQKHGDKEQSLGIIKPVYLLQRKKNAVFYPERF